MHLLQPAQVTINSLEASACACARVYPRVRCAIAVISARNSPGGARAQRRGRISIEHQKGPHPGRRGARENDPPVHPLRHTSRAILCGAGEARARAAPRAVVRTRETSRRGIDSVFFLPCFWVRASAGRNKDLGQYYTTSACPLLHRSASISWQMGHHYRPSRAGFLAPLSCQQPRPMRAPRRANASNASVHPVGRPTP